MNMNKTFFFKKEARKPRWIVIDAKDKVLGRLATKIANILRGKHLSVYTPHADAGDYVIVINASGVKLTGNKLTQKIYPRYSGWMGGLKEETAQDLMKKNPGDIIELAVKRMLPKSKIARAQIKKLKIYPQAEHPHKAQVSVK